MNAVSPVIPVFLSSTWVDLQDERRAVETVLAQFRDTKFRGMEYFGSQPEGALQASLEAVDRALLYIGIFGTRYGSGITQAEYRRARQRGVPCLLYIKKFSNERATYNNPDQYAFITELRRNNDQLVSEFTTAEQLALRVAIDLHHWLFDQYLIPKLQRAAVEHTAPAQIEPVLAAVSEHLALGPVLLRDLNAAGYSFNRFDSKSLRHEARDGQLKTLGQRVYQAWIGGVLEHSVHREAMLAIGRKEALDAIDSPWARHVELGMGTATLERVGNQPIAEVFANAARYLLILGEPGSGKTITLLELARDLLALYDQGLEPQVPVVLTLSTWRRHQRDFAAWCVSALGSQYSVPVSLARSWLNDHRLTLMLDGLDEVPEEDRASCAAALNAFLTDVTAPGVVITCRSEEYAALTTRVRLVSAIRLQPLTPQQIDAYLESGGRSLSGLRQSVRRNDELRTLAQTPLMLSIMSLTLKDATEESAGETLTAATGSTSPPATYRNRLFSLYSERMFRYRNTAPTRREQILGHLAWMAREMQRQGTSIFWLERLQPKWLTSFGQVALYVCVAPLIAAVLIGFWVALEPQNMNWSLGATIIAGVGGGCGLVDILRLTTGSLIGVPAASLRRVLSLIWIAGYLIVPLTLTAVFQGNDVNIFLTAIPAVLGWLLYGFRSAFRGLDADVRVGDELRWSWRHAWRGVGWGCLVSVLVRALFDASHLPLFILPSNPQNLRSFLGDFVDSVIEAARSPGVVFAEEVFWAFPLVGFLVSGLRANIRERTIHPYDGLRRTLRRSILVGIAVGLAVAVAGFWGGPVAEMLGALGVAGFIGWLAFGGIDILRHAALRSVLAASRKLPIRTIRILDEEISLVFLRRAGGGYLFIHRMLLDYFASLPSLGSRADSVRRNRKDARIMSQR